LELAPAPNRQPAQLRQLLPGALLLMLEPAQRVLALPLLPLQGQGLVNGAGHLIKLAVLLANPQFRRPRTESLLVLFMRVLHPRLRGCRRGAGSIQSASELVISEKFRRSPRPARLTLCGLTRGRGVVAALQCCPGVGEPGGQFSVSAEDGG